MNSNIEELSLPPGVAAPFAGECRYLVSLDFDGTLWCEQTRQIPAPFFEMMQRWRPFGVRWGINTGRSLPYLMQDLMSSSPHLPDFICTCERYIYMADAAGRLLPDAAHNAECASINASVRARFAPILQHTMEGLKLRHPEWQWEYAADDPLSIEAIDAATMDAMAPDMNSLAAQDATISLQRAGRYLRFADARFNKGTVLQRVAARWAVPATRIAILGDGHNDLHAFQTLPQAFCAAPSTAHPEVCSWLQAHGGFVSPEPGVLQALQHWANRAFCATL